MNINATLFGQVAFAIAIAMAAIGFYLGKRKTQHPVLMAFIGFLTGFFPPFGAVFIIVLALRKDIQPDAS